MWQLFNNQYKNHLSYDYILHIIISYVPTTTKGFFTECQEVLLRSST